MGEGLGMGGWRPLDGDGDRPRGEGEERRAVRSHAWSRTRCTSPWQCPSSPPMPLCRWVRWA
eukprot:9499005-Pyramimonas_sp.AAC.1